MGNKPSSKSRKAVFTKSTYNRKIKSPSRSTKVDPNSVKKRLDSLTNGSSRIPTTNTKIDILKRKLQRMSSFAERQYNDSISTLKNRAETISEIQYQDYVYPFENVAFEGGGAKGLVYIGCMQVLDELGIEPKRYAGASAGAICAALKAAGYTTNEMQDILEMNLEKILIDHSCGLFSLLPNVVKNFGWNPGHRFTKFMGQLLEKKLGNANVTFKQLYDMKGIELCITAVNLNMLSVEYFHPKTSPNLPIKDAVRMSVSIPGIFQAVKRINDLGQTDVYIDGGLLCNYPVHAFDGWWLSMKQEDSFLNKLQPLSQLNKLMDNRVRFGEYNEKTLGFLVYSSLEQDLMQMELETRIGLTMAERPAQSKLYQARAAALKSKEEALDEHQVFLHALDQFMKTLKTVNSEAGKNADDVVDKEELKQALIRAMANTLLTTQQEDEKGKETVSADYFTVAHLEILFGPGATLDEVFAELDQDGSGAISFDELLSFIERSGINIQAKFQGYDRRELTNVKDFAVSLQECLLTNVKKMFLAERDIDRTVGINTDYIQTTDFNMGPLDREFLIEQGRKATICFLRNYVYKTQPSLKSPALSDEVSVFTETSTLNLDSPLALQPVLENGNELPPIRGRGHPIPISLKADTSAESNSASSGVNEFISPAFSVDTKPQA